MKNPDVPQKLRVQGYEVFHDDTPAQFASFIQADVDKWVPLIKQSGVHID